MSAILSQPQCVKMMIQRMKNSSYHPFLTIHISNFELNYAGAYLKTSNFLFKSNAEENKFCTSSSYSCLTCSLTTFSCVISVCRISAILARSAVTSSSSDWLVSASSHWTWVWMLALNSASLSVTCLTSCRKNMVRGDGFKFKFFIVSNWSITHWGQDKRPPFSRRHFQMHFLEWKCINFD